MNPVRTFQTVLEDKTKYILSALPAFPVVSSFQDIFLDFPFLISITTF